MVVLSHLLLNLFKDCYAAEMIPIRLLISIAVVSAIMLMVFFGFLNLKVALAEKQIENDCRALESKIHTMSSSGVTRDVDEIGAGDGTKRTQNFDLPDSIVFLSFGVDADEDNDGVLETGLTENGAVIYYKVDGGSKKVMWLDEDFRFREGKKDNGRWGINGFGEGFILQNPGESMLSFEFVEKNSKTYILIHSNDGIES